tara:strand:+ start:358 stop:642 length:285 start_codon:yes stop_codon:yes gene_type:complete
MIDTDKYEEKLEHRMNKEFCNDIACGDMHKELAIQYAYEFYGNALDLLAEVKRLREVLKLFEQNFRLEDWLGIYHEDVLLEWCDYLGILPEVDE